MSAKKTSFNDKALDPDKVQRQASDPSASVWLTANAGTGKTKVLTDRVLRLLLDDNAPEDILCVTFTTAAAALMQKRIRRELSIWTISNDADLNKRLQKLTGRKPDAAMRDHARQLFSRFLEAPEGIKIQTIHSLSQTLIQKFPIESGVPPSFKVMDEEDAYNLLRDAQAEILNAVQDRPNSTLAEAVRLITPEVGEEQFISLVNDIVSHRKTFRRILAQHGGLQKTVSEVYSYLGAPEDMRPRDIKFLMGDDHASAVEGPDMGALYHAVEILSGGSKTDKDRAETLKLWLDASAEERALMFDEYTKIFLTDSGDIRKTLATKQAEEARDILGVEAERLTQTIELIKTVSVAGGTEALLVLGDAVLEAYEARKEALNYLDYDDLIDKAARLMADETKSDWVLRKMPGNLKHILVDEAQDTSPEQWRIVASLMTGLLADDKAAADKTLFVVGDEKQSIFSFQGADPEEFMARKKYFESLVTKAGGKWRNVDMDITFRSTQGILDAVDAVFKDGEAASGVKADNEKNIHHVSFRTGHSGLIEINPPVVGQKHKDTIEPWSLPEDMEDLSEAGLDLAEEIADRIKDWIDNGEKLESRGREIIPSDIMILVRRRSQFMNYMVRALKRRDIAVAGVDRMVLSEQLAVKDMLALGEVMLNRSDDYKLAVVLKSPVIGMTEQQLADLAIGREGSLWDELKQRSQSRAKKNAVYKKAYTYMNGLSERLKQESVFEFYSNILMQKCPAHEMSGLASIYKRLGNEAEDPMVEFLNALERYEKDNPPSLQGFIHWLEAGEAEIKREISLDANEPKVNIMTVHGAKGLEAPIVILPDTTGIPSDNIAARPRLLWPVGNRKIPLWVPTTAQENQIFKREKAIIEDARDDEYKRLLYVAMTRAADRLYVYGHHNRDNLRGLSWHKMISDGLKNNLGDKLDIEPVDEEKGIERIVYRTAQTSSPQDDGVKTSQRTKKTILPDWARAAAKKPAPSKPAFVPSKALNDKISSNDNDKTRPSPLQPRAEKFDIFKQGTITHNLLEFLPRIPKDKRENVARRYLSQQAWGFSENLQNRMLDQLRSVLNAPDYDFIFGHGSRAEVNIAANVMVKGVEHELNGQIDRLVVKGDDVWIIDYKSNRNIPTDADKIPELYVAQMAAYQHVMRDIYPGKNVKCALLWTRAPKLQELSQKSMDDAVKKLGLGVKTAPAKPKSKKAAP